MAKLSLDEINRALAPFSEELAARMKWDELIADFSKKQEELKQTLIELDQQIASERADVDRLEQAGIYRFWKTLQGEYESALETEYLEWEAALGEREKLAGRLAEIEERLQFLRARKAQLGDIDQPIEDLLRLKRQAFREAIKDPLYQLESQIDHLKIRKLGLSGILVPMPGLLYDLNRLCRGLRLNQRFIKSKKVFSTFGSTIESIEQRFASMIRSLDLYHKNSDKRLPFHGGYFSNFEGRAKAVEAEQLLAWFENCLLDVRQLDQQIKLLQSQTESEIKSAQQQHQKLLLNI